MAPEMQISQRFEGYSQQLVTAFTLLDQTIQSLKVQIQLQTPAEPTAAPDILTKVRDELESWSGGPLNISPEVSEFLISRGLLIESSPFATVANSLTALRDLQDGTPADDGIALSPRFTNEIKLYKKTLGAVQELAPSSVILTAIREVEKFVESSSVSPSELRELGRQLDSHKGTLTDAFIRNSFAKSDLARPEMELGQIDRTSAAVTLAEELISKLSIRDISELTRSDDGGILAMSMVVGPGISKELRSRRLTSHTLEKMRALLERGATLFEGDGALAGKLLAKLSNDSELITLAGGKYKTLLVEQPKYETIAQKIETLGADSVEGLQLRSQLELCKQAIDPKNQDFSFDRIPAATFVQFMLDLREIDKKTSSDLADTVQGYLESPIIRNREGALPVEEKNRARYLRKQLLREKPIRSNTLQKGMVNAKQLATADPRYFQETFLRPYETEESPAKSLVRQAMINSFGALIAAESKQLYYSLSSLTDIYTKRVQRLEELDDKNRSFRFIQIRTALRLMSWYKKVGIFTPTQIADGRAITRGLISDFTHILARESEGGVLTGRVKAFASIVDPEQLKMLRRAVKVASFFSEGETAKYVADADFRRITKLRYYEDREEFLTEARSVVNFGTHVTRHGIQELDHLWRSKLEAFVKNYFSLYLHFTKVHLEEKNKIPPKES